jgi:hypothetical protein
MEVGLPRRSLGVGGRSEKRPASFLDLICNGAVATALGRVFRAPEQSLATRKKTRSDALQIAVLLRRSRGCGINRRSLRLTNSPKDESNELGSRA